ncbi:hypothetical protein, partial [Lactobacillus helveticus]|uniref:hypothetical protein n=1 Tax=Lactobacillus helveticus TaxID=1587 RepID=UPI001C64C65D
YQSLNQNSLRGKPVQRKRTKQPFNGCLILFIYSLSTGFDKEPFYYPAIKIFQSRLLVYQLCGWIAAKLATMMHIPAVEIVIENMQLTKFDG